MRAILRKKIGGGGHVLRWRGGIKGSSIVSGEGEVDVGNDRLTSNSRKL